MIIETLVILALAAIGAYELACVIGDGIARIRFNREQARRRGIDPSTFTCTLCKHPYDIVGETPLHIVWRCFCGKSEYRQRKRGKK